MSNDDDSFLTFVAVSVLIAMFGPALLAATVPAVAETLVSWRILTAEDVLVPIASGFGLDLPRVAIAAGVLFMASLAGFFGIRRRMAARHARP